MDNNELESHIKEYEKEYRFIAYYTKMDFKYVTENHVYIPSDIYVKMLRQYANDVQKKPEIFNSYDNICPKCRHELKPSPFAYSQVKCDNCGYID
jgi:hypothetical protein